jgi:uncharacterized protein YjbI with pentapeptide repeats
LWAVGMVIALVALGLLVAKLYPSSMWETLSRERVASLIGIGVALTVLIVLLAIGGASLGWTGFGEKKLWDWLQLLSALAIPVVIAVGTLWFTDQQNDLQRDIEAQRAQAEQQLEEQRAQDEALQAYLDQMGQLLLEKNLRDSEEDSEVSTLARARTLTVLRRLDGTRKASVLQFLYESGLISAEDGPIVSLRGTDLSGANLREANLSGADLREANLSEANLRAANLSYANLGGDVDLREPNPFSAYLGGDVDLSRANLKSAYLRRADLSDAELDKANLSEANLIKANLESATLDDTDLSDAYLQEANLGGAHLMGANLKGAELRGGVWDLGGAELAYADLTDAQVTEEQLAAAKSLKMATMPNGQKYEDWLKTPEGQDWLNKYKKGSGDDGESTGPP